MSRIVSRTLSFFVHDRVGAPARGTLAVRIVVGSVFMVSGAMKLLFDNQGPARFAKIGFAAPAAVSSFVAGVELVAGTCLILGLFVRLAALPLIVDMCVAIATTKVPLLLGGGPEIPAAAPKAGFWAFAYQARLDTAMLVTCAYLVAIGAGLLSLDELLRKRNASEDHGGVVPARGARARPLAT
jgi:uncharacterized membrane protein YphA (DoxX/SURF4 family)